MTTKQRQRSERVIARLTSQMESGFKTEKGTVTKKVPLTEKDKKRIQKEIATITQRVA